MIKNEAKDLFQLQTNLIDAKVEDAVSKVIDRVVDQIRSLRDEMHGLRHDMNAEINGLRHDMNERFSALDNRVIAVETKLGMVNKSQEEMRSRFIDYAFKAGWLILGVFITYGLTQFHSLVNFIK